MCNIYTIFQQNPTWEIVTDKKTVGCRWIFIVKHKADGSIVRYKARLVAKGILKLMELKGDFLSCSKDE